MIHSNPTLTELLEWIELYFDCQLSDEEEAALRVIIARTPLSHPSIDEARALMGFRSPVIRQSETNYPNSSRRSWPSRLRPALGIAAAVAVIMTLGIYLIGYHVNPSVSNSKCMAYANGQCITDEADVIRLLTADLQEFNDETDELDQSLYDELDAIAPIIEDAEMPTELSEMADEFTI